MVSNLPASAIGEKDLYENVCCSRGEIENRIKEVQLALFSDRTNSGKINANQLRSYFSGFAYVLSDGEMRRLGLSGTANARLRCDSLRLRLLKVAGRVRITHRRVWFSMSTAYPFRAVFAGIVDRLAGVSVYHPSPG